MSNLFYVDTDREISYQQLLDDINSATQVKPFLYTSDYYSIFKEIIVAILYERELTILDYDTYEIENLISSTDKLDINYSIEHPILFRSVKNFIKNRNIEKFDC